MGDQYDRALRQAQELDLKLNSLSDEEREEEFSSIKKPLLGVPLSVKECFAWTGEIPFFEFYKRNKLRIIFLFVCFCFFFLI